MQTNELYQTEPLLTVAEVAQLIGCSEQYIRSLLARGGLNGEKRLNERNRPVYHIPLSALDAKAQRRYRKAKGQVLELPQREPRPLDHYSRNEREQIHFWGTLLDDWQEYRKKPTHSNMATADQQFVAYAQVAYLDEYYRITERAFTLSVDTLYRRWRAYRAGDTDGLVEKRGKATKGTSAMPDIVWDAFLSFYLDQRQFSIMQCLEYTQYWVAECRPELAEDIPHYSSFYRRVQNDIPAPLGVLAREGEKAYRDRCAPYIQRVYDDMQSNDYWVADTHTLDVMSSNEEGKTRRLYLTAFFDARSGIFTGCTITDRPGSQAVLTALRKGIQKHGIPTYIYVDNGREFLTRDVGGLGHRQKKSTAHLFEPPGVFKRLGITMINALVRNARAKVIERRFLDIKNRLSRLFETYTGGNVLEKPEQLAGNLKAGKAPTDVELIETAELLLDWYFNQQPYNGAVGRDHGKSRMQVFLENLHTKRVAPEDDLSLMMMRSSRLQKVGRLGITHKVGQGQIHYWNDELVGGLLFGQEVYYRYDPENLAEIRLYDKEDRFIMTVPAESETIRKHGCSQEELKLAQRKIRQVEKTQKEALRNSGLSAYDRMSALDLVILQAKKNRASFVPPDIGPNVLQLERANETPALEKAVGHYDIDTMIRNAEKRQKGGSKNE